MRRYVDAATAAGLTSQAGEAALGDGLISVVCEAVRPNRLTGQGAACFEEEREWVAAALAAATRD